ncbi:hypothetical protein HMPREF1618_02693 [Escherichia coli 908691]|nr:hypothetical protein HMPREF1618_02693 [Escherichia coli 908691]
MQARNGHYLKPRFTRTRHKRGENTVTQYSEYLDQSTNIQRWPFWGTVRQCRYCNKAENSTKNCWSWF